ncbi:MAG TPA: hypothetical protein VL173_01675 [Vicinamibacterales bacterium]|nr:hypothetical protein [Vicinamibacterales bacterium]
MIASDRGRGDRRIPSGRNRADRTESAALASIEFSNTRGRDGQDYDRDRRDDGPTERDHRAC